MMSANAQVSLEPSLQALRADDPETVDSDIGFVKIHYEVVDCQPSAPHRVSSVPSGDLAPELDDDGTPTAAFGKHILVDRSRDGYPATEERDSRVVSVIHSLRQLYTKLKLNDNIAEKPALLKTTVSRVGYEGDFDLLEELVGRHNLFQDTYPYSFVKTSQRVRPAVDFQFRLSRTAEPKSAQQQGVWETGVLGLKDVANSFSKVEVQDQQPLLLEWPASLKDLSDPVSAELPEGFLPVALRAKHRHMTEWVRRDLLDQSQLTSSLEFKFDHFTALVPQKAVIVVEVHYFLGKSQPTLKKADFSAEATKDWQKVSLQSLSKSEHKKVYETKVVTSREVEAISHELSKSSGSQMFFYSYLKIENDPVARVVSFESLPDYSKFPRMPVALEEFLSKKLKKK